MFQTHEWRTCHESKLYGFSDALEFAVKRQGFLGDSVGPSFFIF